MPNQPHELTTSQTVGPFFHDCLLRADAVITHLATPATIGERIRIEGRILDGDGVGVPDAMIELWQANAYGRYQHPADTRDLPLDPSFTGYGRSGTDSEGRFVFETIRPGPVPFDHTSMQAPHLCITIFGRGLLNHLITRIYFDDQPANASDPILLLVPAERRATMIAMRVGASEPVVFQHTLLLQGASETVFLNCLAPVRQ
jgi:protocatechuate 3,4-dioxygenase alpha subunit